MIVCRGEQKNYLTTFSNGQHSACADVTADRGGQAAGFRPTELIEAALASCMNITVRMAAQKHGIALTSVTTGVSLEKPTADESVFVVAVELEGAISDDQRAVLMEAADACVVKKMLTTRMTFQHASEE